ncbi:elongation factor P 5-aminopentanone reductase [Desemzia sp. FAM 23991]|uniref:elongation factor P 5-aminopentanone reductase n=1 Tax=unclassified Desemzia TaxID=2685243 RepID=UPI003884E1E7
MKFALIMGASGGIGQAIAFELAQDSWSLYLHYNNGRDTVEQQIKELQEQFPKQDFFALQMDMKREESVSKFVENLFQVDAVVFASGFTEYHLLTEVSVTEIHDLLAVHLTTPIQIIQLLQTKLAKSEFGRVVFISSVYGEAGSAMEVMYSTAKGAQSAFVKAYSKEVASLGITVNALAPGAIETTMIQDFTPEELEALKEDIPVGRLGHVQDVSFWVKQLVDKRSEYLTGQTITVSGGWLR